GIDLLITKMNKDNDMPEEMRRFFEPEANGVGGEADEDEAAADEPRAFYDLDPADDANTELDPVVMQDLGNTDDQGYDDYWSYQETHALAFDDIDDLLALADSLLVSDLASSVYYYKHKFYLKLAFMDENYAEIKPADAWAIANEFGYQVPEREMLQAQEHGQCLFQQDALGALRRQFVSK
ncbi:adaptor protein MecA, partial [Lactobacillus nasalidis]